MHQTCDQLDVGICQTRSLSGSDFSSSPRWQIKPYIDPVSELEPSTWVKLQAPPSPYSSDDALLLCRQDADHWLAWIPDYGEIILASHEILLD